jgi:hypothetical protein
MRWTQRRRARSWSQGGIYRERFNVTQTTGVSRPSPELRIGISPVGGAGEGAAYGEVVWFWHPWLMSSQRRRVGPTGLRQLSIRWRRWQKEFVAGKSTYKP